MRISDWSSDVCSSDLGSPRASPISRCAHAQREIGLALGEPPALKGYPPSALALIPRLVERAGVDARSGGSITALRSAARRVGTECVSTCRSRWSLYL